VKRLFVFVVVAAIAATSCGNNDPAVVVYSGRTENLVGPLFEAFTDETGIEVEVRYAPSADLALLIGQEGDKSPADVFISQSPGAIGLLAGQGLLTKLSGETLDLVSADYRNTDGFWVGLSGRVRVLVYNRELVDEEDLPSSVFSLADSAYRGRVAVAPANGSFQDFVTGLREIHGDDVAVQWLGAMKANNAPTYANNSAIVQAVGRGEVDMGLVNHYYNLRALAEDPSLSSVNHYFDDVGSLVIITAAGVMKSSQQLAEAEMLLRFLLSADSQAFFGSETYEYPLAVDSRPPAELPELSEVNVETYDFEDLSGGLTRTKELIDASGLEAP
jgi:iron(III) transport system substrate-binding protein